MFNTKFLNPKIIAVSVVVLIVLATVFYVNFKNSKDSQDVVQLEVEKLINEVSQIAVLPKDEIPSVATISDPDLLKSQLFFSKSKRGDKLLLYSKAKIAVLYRPSDNKIVELASVETK